MSTEDPDGYPRLAAEYYDSARHPTTHALGVLSMRLIDGAIARLPMPDGPAVEVGAGRGVIPDLLARDGAGSRTVIVSDRYAEMLQHARSEPAARGSLVLMDARRMAVRTAHGALVVASLGAPFNGEALWLEVARVLRPGGFFLLTTPAHRWAEDHRRRLVGTPDRAVYVLGDETVSVRSLTRSSTVYRRWAMQSGLILQDVVHTGRRDLGSIPPGDLSVLDLEEPAVTLTIARR
jgi:SAM-dependent methyltransferase